MPKFERERRWAQRILLHPFLLYIGLVLMLRSCRFHDIHVLVKEGRDYPKIQLGTYREQRNLSSSS